MSIARVSLSLAGVLGVLALGLAGAIIWLWITEPISGADAVGKLAEGDASPLARALAGVLYEALKGLLKYL